MELSTIEKQLLKKTLERFLEEDIRYGDITTKILKNSPVHALVLYKSKGLVCGVEEARLLCEIGNVSVIDAIPDGEQVEKGTQIMALSGNLYDILGIERTLLNIMMRMSSIATTTHEFITKIQSVNKHVKIAATRKTIPGFRLFEKRAVIVGGKGYSDSHRWSLDDMVLIKDTHLNASRKRLPELIADAKKSTSFTKKIEVEVQSPEDAILAAQSQADIIMFDNMSPSKIQSTIQKIHKTAISKQMPIMEASGNITLDNILDYANCGVDIISTSQLTLFPHVKIDISLEILRD